MIVNFNLLLGQEKSIQVFPEIISDSSLVIPFKIPYAGIVEILIYRPYESKPLRKQLLCDADTASVPKNKFYFPSQYFKEKGQYNFKIIYKGKEYAGEFNW